MDLNKTPDSLELNEEAALKITATELVESEKTQKKKFHFSGQCIFGFIRSNKE
mgnify:CR=1 FL=1